MKYSANAARQIKSIAVLGNYLPRQCGIATFTTDLVESLSEQAQGSYIWAVAMNDQLSGYAYPEKVRFEINQNQLSDYGVASQFLNINSPDIVCVQHEYGLFGGLAGSHLLKLLGDLRMPVVTTLHTVLKKPEPDYRNVMNRLSELSDKLVVMSHGAAQMLREIYNVPEDKISFIHHGIAEASFLDPNFNKDKFGVEGKTVLLTFGLVSPNKGIETVLHALPTVIEKHPDVVYIILGATHPNVLKADGDAYRLKLQQLVRELNLGDNVIFQNRFVDNEELWDFLGIADIYITPYLNEEQITSGTLVYAMGAGKAIISTPYWYATEMLSDGRGAIVPFNNPKAMVVQILKLLGSDIERNAMRKKAYIFTRDAVWSEVSRKYIDIFERVIRTRGTNPRPRHDYVEHIKAITHFELPEIKLDHLKSMTDDTGILQHALHTIPNRDHGYCTDDNARALIVACMGQKFMLINGSGVNSLCGHYLGFLLYALNNKKGRFRNFMSYSRHWEEDVGSEDSHGRALRSLGKAVEYTENPGYLALSATLFEKALNVIESFRSPRAIAFCLEGMQAYLKKFSGDSDVRRIMELLSSKLLLQFKNNFTEEWPWLENSLHYANGKLPHALLLSGVYFDNAEMTDMGLSSLRWLLSIQTRQNHFSPIGSYGGYKKGSSRARFDQQPIEANSMIEACVEAFKITRDKFWFASAVMCFNWFLGHNDLNLPLYDPKTGGCRDGLMADGINQNEGAESSLAWLLSLMTMKKIYADELVHQPIPEENSK